MCSPIQASSLYRTKKLAYKVLLQPVVLQPVLSVKIVTPTIPTWKQRGRIKSAGNFGLAAGVFDFRQQIDNFVESRVVLSSLNHQAENDNVRSAIL